MNKLVVILIGALLAASCSNIPKNEYVVSGNISGKVPAQALLKIYDAGNWKTIDSADFINGSFKFKGSVAEPDYYFVQIGETKNRMGFFLENSKITINANIDSLNKAVVKGSKLQDQFNAYTKLKTEFDMQLRDLYNKYQNAENQKIKNKIEIAYDSVDNLKLEASKKYVIKNNNSILAPYIIRRELIFSLELAELDALTNALSPDLKENKYAKQLYERIKTLRSLEPGMVAPEFTQNDPSGNPINLSDFKGKYLLIDFWASWCRPCRNANPTIVATYNKYVHKNFTILGVSMDSDKNKWLEAIEADGLIWSHVSTLEGWDNPVGKKYAVNGIPHAVLIDPEGKIVKRGIHAGELDEILKGLLN